MFLKKPRVWRSVSRCLRTYVLSHYFYVLMPNHVPLLHSILFLGKTNYSIWWVILLSFLSKLKRKRANQIWLTPVDVHSWGTRNQKANPSLDEKTVAHFLSPDHTGISAIIMLLPVDPSIFHSPIAERPQLRSWWPCFLAQAMLKRGKWMMSGSVLFLTVYSGRGDTDPD